MEKNKLIKLLLGVFLIIISFSWIFFNKGYGTNGDDAEGYIYMTNKYLQNNGFVFKDDNLANFIKNYGDNYDYNDYYTSFVSNRYKLLNKDGYVSPRYPIGISIFISPFAFLDKYFGLDYSQVFLFTFIVLVFYLIIHLIIEKIDTHKEKPIYITTFAFLGGLLIFGGHYNFQVLATGQIVREIPSMFFMLMLIFSLSKYIQSKYENKKFLFIASFFFGCSILIRETNVLLGVLFIPFLLDYFKKIKLLIPSILIFLFSIGGYFYIFYEVKELSKINSLEQNFLNLDHINSFSINYFFNNYQSYLKYLGIDRLNIINVGMIFFVLGVIFMKIKKIISTRLLIFFFSLGVYVFLTFILFTSWPNPFNRYVISIYLVFFFYFIIGYYIIVKNLKHNYIITLLLVFTLLSTKIGVTQYENSKFFTRNDFNKIIKNINQTSQKTIYLSKENNITNNYLKEMGYGLSSYFSNKTFFYESNNEEINNLLKNNTYAPN